MLIGTAEHGWNKIYLSLLCLWVTDTTVPDITEGIYLKKGEVKMRIKKSGLEEALKAAD